MLSWLKKLLGFRIKYTTLNYGEEKHGKRKYK